MIVNTKNNLLYKLLVPFMDPDKDNPGAPACWLQLELVEGNPLRTYSLFMGVNWSPFPSEAASVIVLSLEKQKKKPNYLRLIGDFCQPCTY